MDVWALDAVVQRKPQLRKQQNKQTAAVEPTEPRAAESHRKSGRPRPRLRFESAGSCNSSNGCRFPAQPYFGANRE